MTLESLLAGVSNPKAAKEAEALNQHESDLEFFRPASRAPLANFTGIWESWSQESKEFEGKVTNVLVSHWKVLSVEKEAVSKGQKSWHYDGSGYVDIRVNIPAPGRSGAGSPQSEMQLTVASAQEIDESISGYHDLFQKKCRLKEDFITLKDRDGKDSLDPRGYPIRVFFYKVLSIEDASGKKAAPVVDAALEDDLLMFASGLTESEFLKGELNNPNNPDDGYKLKPVAQEFVGRLAGPLQAEVMTARWLKRMVSEKKLELVDGIYSAVPF